MNKMIIAAVLALLAFAGCRQKDERDFTVDVPALVQGNEAAVAEGIRSALAGCCGIDMSTLAFDSANHCVKMRYDSTIPPLRMLSPLPHDLCDGRSSSG